VAALSGRRLDALPEPLAAPLARLFEERSGDPRVLQLALRFGSRPGVEASLRLVADAGAVEESRLALIRTLGEIREASAVDSLLALLKPGETDAVQSAAVAALGYFDDDRVADAALASYGQLGGGARARAVELLCGRKAWSGRLLDAVIAEKIPRDAVSIGQLRQILEHGDPQLEKVIASNFGRIQPETPHETQGRIRSILEKLNRGQGDPAKGLALYEKTCGTCHKLHGKGNEVGPDLTAADRKNRERLVGNVVDPNSMIREQFVAHIAVTSDGRVLTGLLAEQTAETVTILDEKNKRTVLRRDDLDELRESPVSLMPERILDPLSDDQIRDLFALLESNSLPAAENESAGK
jgi:putative heme-binding domain-containing protein